MDTFAESTVITKETDTGKEANEKIKEICEEIENRISNTIETSEIYKINLNSQLFWSAELSPKTSGLLETVRQLQEVTDGAFNPFLGEIIDLWGINNQDESAERKRPEKDDFYPALEKVHNFNYESGSDLPKIDLGAIGKGYAIDEISDYLVEAGIPNALVSFGSSVLASGKNKSGNLWTVGIKDPLKPDELCGWISASDKVISVSGGYERFITIDGKDYCHIIDPETGYPADNDLLCVVVVMSSQSALKSQEYSEKQKNSGAMSDALSTALYVMGKEKALKFYNTSKIDFEMILFVKDEEMPNGYDIISSNLIFNEISYD